VDLTGAQLYFLDEAHYQPTVISTKRIGIDYAAQWKDAPLRFVDSSLVTLARRREVKPTRSKPH
jgi:3-methyladenine DNA glycosylase Mpg